ncbi:MAG: penicillin-binding transpeptidase domain-containing protein [Oscillospiraceae bacterium]|nr:penicillin-binding transpeptidase domain-containing protein [Oscillospiraceae bacterium]
MKIKGITSGVFIVLSVIVLLLTGCRNSESNKTSPETSIESDIITTEDNASEDVFISNRKEDADYSKYFQNYEGTAVFYSVEEQIYRIYNKELAELPSSPCSTFKIISGLMGLESGVIDTSNSIRQWNGTYYPMAAWNKDLDFKQAFQDTCIWYFREVIDLMGEEYVQGILDELNYGNRDISEWEGSLDNLIFPHMADLKELNGFWHESSLKISPVHKVDVLRRIFEERDVFNYNNLNTMKDAMYIENNDSSIIIYGKTGSGITDDNWVNAWFAGMFEYNGDITYFTVRLNQPDARGADARDVAVNIINGEFGN